MELVVVLSACAAIVLTVVAAVWAIEEMEGLCSSSSRRQYKITMAISALFLIGLAIGGVG